MPTQSKLLFPIVIWTAAFLRFPALFANHYHADEALFSSWARLIAIWRDPLLASQPVDKPPLLFYLQALFYPLFGPVEWASRIPDFAASLLLIPLTGLFAWRLYRRQSIALVAATFVTLSPMAIQYSATAYTDPLLAMLLVMALALTADRSSSVWAGFVFGLAVVTKYQAWLFLPLVYGIARLRGWDNRSWRRWAAGLAPVLLVLFVWTSARTGLLAIWSNQMRNFGGLRLAHSWELVQRLHGWANLWQIVLGSTPLVLLLVAVLAALVIRGVRSRRQEGEVDFLLVVFLLAYMLFHWLLAVPVWDRYLLPVIPVAALLLARGFISFAGWLRSRERSGRLPRSLPLALLLALVLVYTLPAAVAARSGQWPTGGRPTADQGAWQVAAFLKDAPYGTVLYDHWYSWHWRYHFLDKRLYVSWFPHAAALAGDLQAFADAPDARYLVVPEGEVARPILRALHDAGYRLDEAYRTTSRPGMILYRISKCVSGC